MVALLLGALTTVCIAWALAVGVNTIMHPGRWTIRQTPGALWAVQDYTWFGAWSTHWSPVDWAARSGTDPEEFDARAHAEATLNGGAFNEPPRVVPIGTLLDDGHACNLSEHRRGWPFHALGCATAVQPVWAEGASGRVQTHWGFAFRPGRPASWDIDLVHLPLKPLFPGFYADSLLYAAAWWAVCFWRPMRRKRRIARGLCPACAYSLAGLPAANNKCPECGTVTPTALRQLASAN